MDIAIKYEKIDLTDDKYVFKPVGVVKGIYDKQSGIFETECGELLDSITGNVLGETFYFGALTTLKKLMEVDVADDEKSVLFNYFEMCKLNYSIGYYDEVEKKLEVVHIPFEDIEKAVSEYNQEAEEYFETADDNVNITLTFEELLKLRNIDDIKKLHGILDELIKIAEEMSVEIPQYTENNEDINLEGETELLDVPKLALQKEKSKTNILKELRKEVKDVIKGQDKAVDDVTRAVVVNQLSKNPRHKNHILITGPSGTGKTEMINIITKKLGIPYFKADATAYTIEGYVGKSVYSMFKGLLEAANNNLSLAERGVLVIDEIDKKLSSRNDDVGGIDVLNSLLKIMDREMIEIDLNRNKTEMFDTSNLTIIFMGAFADLYKSKEENKKKVIGFNSTVEEESKKEKITITNEDLIKAGMPPEFLGRIPIVTNTEELDLDTLVEILYKSKGGAIDEEKEFCSDLGVDIKFTGPYMREIAKKAYASKTGARNLRKLVRESLADAYDEILSRDDVKVLKLTKKTALNPKDYYIEYM